MLMLSNIPAPCPEGSFSHNGYEPGCALCPIGFYSTENKTNCDACAYNMTTPAAGAVNSSICTGESVLYITLKVDVGLVYCHF